MEQCVVGGRNGAPQASLRRSGRGWWKCPSSAGEGGGGKGKFIRWPRGVANGDGYLVVVSEGLVALVVCFAYDEESAAAIEGALRRPRWTRSKLTASGWQHHGSPGQKSHDIVRIRNERVQGAARWFLDRR